LLNGYVIETMEKNKELVRLIGEENFKQLPLIYSTLNPSVNGKGMPVSIVESEFHQTKAYSTEPFYKPISKIIIIQKENNG